jgi:predicted MFS family arabinose efflux permease
MRDFAIPLLNLHNRQNERRRSMVSILRPFVSLYLATLLLVMGLGLLATFLSLRLTVEGYSAQTTGFILTAYYTGMIVGTFYCGRLIRSIGHIRSFSAFAALATGMIMLHGYYISAVAWAIFRFFLRHCYHRAVYGFGKLA